MDGLDVAGGYQCQIDGANADRLDITGTLDISTGATVDFITLAAPTEDEKVIATFGLLLGPALEFTNLSSGYEVDDATNGVIKLVRVAGYASWANSRTGPALVDKTPGGDPNDMEIRIPLGNAENGKLFGRLKVEETPAP